MSVTLIKNTVTPQSGYTWEHVACWCGTEVPDNPASRQGHQEFWHTDARPATWRKLPTHRVA